MTSGQRDIEAGILRREATTDDYGQPSAVWNTLATLWIAEDVRSGSARVSDRDQPSFTANFTALETDCRHLRANDMVQVYYADYKIDAITRAPGSKGLVTLVCSATQSSQVVPGDGTPDGDTTLFTNNHL